MKSIYNKNKRNKGIDSKRNTGGLFLYAENNN